MLDAWPRREGDAVARCSAAQAPCSRWHADAPRSARAYARRLNSVVRSARRGGQPSALAAVFQRAAAATTRAQRRFRFGPRCRTVSAGRRCAVACWSCRAMPSRGAASGSATQLCCRLHSRSADTQRPRVCFNALVVLVQASAAAWVDRFAAVVAALLDARRGRCGGSEGVQRLRAEGVLGWSSRASCWWATRVDFSNEGRSHRSRVLCSRSAGGERIAIANDNRRRLTSRVLAGDTSAAAAMCRRIESSSS